MLDPVVGGEVTVAEGDQGGDQPQRLQDGLARRSRPPRLRIMPEAARAPPTEAITRQSSNGSRASGRRRRTSGSTAIASASFSGPRTSGALAASSGAIRGFGSEATAISPSGPRTAAAQWVGPWISSPLRSAIPPRRKVSRSGIGRLPSSRFGSW